MNQIFNKEGSFNEDWWRGMARPVACDVLPMTWLIEIWRNHLQTYDRNHAARNGLVVI